MAMVMAMAMDMDMAMEDMVITLAKEALTLNQKLKQVESTVTMEDIFPMVMAMGIDLAMGMAM